MPNWRSFGARLIGPPCRDTNGGDHQGIANPYTGNFCIDKGRIGAGFGGDANQRYEFVVVHEFMHIATKSFFFPGPRAGWPGATDHNGWAPLLGVDPQQLRDIETQKPAPTGAGKLVADCLAWNLTGYTTEEYWQTWAGGGSCSRNSTAVGTTQRIRDELLG